MSQRKICVVTGSRADYGLLRPVLKKITCSKDLQLSLVATGAHLSPGFGMTVSEIEKDGFELSKKVEMLLGSETARGVTKSMGLGMIGFADAFVDLSPDLVMVLGDRYEILAAAISALIARIPLAHIHGGETTEGAFDEAIRHSITKMSQLHFVAAERYRDRVIQMGENPRTVFNVGGLGVDNIQNMDLLGRAELEASLSLSFGEKNLLVTFHPETLSPGQALIQMQELLAAFDSFRDITLIFTMPNADPENGVLIGLINRFIGKRGNAYLVPSIGTLRYLSCMKIVDGVIGNSSSGLTEAPSFHIGTINVGDRQRGRLRADSVIDCEARCEEIVSAVRRLYEPEYVAIIKQSTSPYGSGGASEKIVDIIESFDFAGLVKKTFFDLPR